MTDRSILRVLGGASALIAATAVAAAIPTGARTERSGFLTIEEAPPMPPQPDKPRLSAPRDERSYYAQIADVSEGEAAKRLKEQEASRRQFERVLAQVRKREAGNFTDVRMIHKPDWAYVFYFKRAPQRTLVKYTKHSHFKAAQAKYSHRELEALARPWVDRFKQQRLLTGHGTDATYGIATMNLVVSETEFREITAREGWGRLPAAIKLEFSSGVAGDAVDPKLRPHIRIFAHSDRALGITNQAALGGRIVVRDGCFWVVGRGQPDRLAYFPREVGLSVDRTGFLALRSRLDGKLIGRIGEEFTWGGPIGISETAPMVADLRRQCGPSPIEHVGMLTSRHEFQRLYGR